jgi:hypothetical protein
MPNGKQEEDMEFGIGFVLGGVSTGVTVANWASVVKAVQLLAAKGQAAIEGTFRRLK